MNKTELQRRLATIAPATLEKAVAMVRAGYGNLTLECDVTQNVPAEALRGFFTRETGLDCTLGTMGRK